MNLIDQIAENLELLTTDYGSRLWVQYTTGFDHDVNESQQKIDNYKKDKDNFKTISETLSKTSDPIEKRKAQILYNTFIEFHHSDKANKIITEIQVLENSIMDVINKNRSVYNGVETSASDLGKIRSQSPDRSQRQKAYEAPIALNKKVVDSGFINLLNLRKQLAVTCGFDSFVDLKLKSDELNLDIFKDWSGDCVKRKDLFKQKTQIIAGKFLDAGQIEPWDYSYLKNKVCSYNQTEMDLTNFLKPMSKTFSKFGFDIQNLNLTFDIFPRKNKSEWGYNFPITIGKDARVLANVSNRFSDFWVLLHETAHGVHFLGLDPDEKVFNSGVSGIVAEGFANFFGNQAYSKEFLTEVFPDDDIEKIYLQFKDSEKITHLQNFRSVPEILFDQQLYTKDITSLKDINDLKYSLNESLLGEKSAVEEIPWAQMIHHTLAPIYLHNYLLGDVMCDKMKNVFSRHNHGEKSEDKPLKFGQFWKEKVLEPSGRYSFLDLYEKICEEKLSLTDYLDSKVLAD